MFDNGYIFSKDSERIFINTSLGCLGKCSYCYLPRIGYNDVDNLKRMSFEDIMGFIKGNNIKLSSKTLITLGCYSECLDDCNKRETFKLIKYFLKNGNQVQLSTKKMILEKDFKELVPFIKYYGQLVVFVSSATISKQKEIEKNTSSIDDRFSNFLILNKLNIPVVLYIKPVLQDITIKDLDLYKEYILKYGIKDVVVGSMFSSSVSNERVHFSNEINLFYNENCDESIIISSLAEITNVYRRSTEVMKKYELE